MSKAESRVFDLGGRWIVRVTQGRKRANSGFFEAPELHLFPVPGPGVAHTLGLKVEDVETLRELQHAIAFALGQVPKEGE